MSPELLTLIGLGAGAYFLGNNQKFNKQFDDCIVGKVLAPVEGIFNTFYSNKGLIVDYVKENSIIINTPFMYKIIIHPMALGFWQGFL